jgi:HNH endonuclease/C-5 cytosine-specific DNA methylase
MRIGSLFSGAGGLDMAVEAAFGGTTVWHAEIDTAASKVLAHHWPGVPNLGSVTEIDWANLKGHIMAWPRCDEKAQAMYDLYCQGMSLAQVAERHDCTRQSVYGLFQTRGLEMRSRPAARPTVVYRGIKYSLRNNGYYGATSGDRQLLHRVMWEAEIGSIPDGYDIHHLDHDKTNNVIENFECLPKDEHARKYNIGCNGARHRCGIGAVMPEEANTVDILTGGFP